MTARETEPASAVLCLEEDIPSPCQTEILGHLSAESLLHKKQPATAVLLACSSTPPSVPSKKSLCFAKVGNAKGRLSFPGSESIALLLQGLAGDWEALQDWHQSEWALGWICKLSEIQVTEQQV